MYGLFTYIYHNFRPNVGKYTIHWASGYWKWSPFFWFQPVHFQRPLRKKKTVPDWLIAVGLGSPHGPWYHEHMAPRDKLSQSRWSHRRVPWAGRISLCFFFLFFVLLIQVGELLFFTPKWKEWKMKMEASWQKYLWNHVTYRDLRCTLELVPSVLCLKFFLKPRISFLMKWL